MKATCGLRAPSTSLLRFLRCQLDAPAAVPHSVATRHAVHPKLPLSRHCRAFNTTRVCRAVPAPQYDRLSNHDRHHTQTRDFATSSLRQAFWQHLRFNGSSNAKAARPLQQNDLPPLQGFLDDHAGLHGGRVVKPGYDGRLRCTEYDEDGKITLVDTEFKKSELIAKYSLLPRDLRKIDSSVLPHILVRPSAILINLLHLRCLIKHDRVLVFDVYGSTDSYAQSLFMYDLEDKLRQKQATTAAALGGNLPYEFRALEAVLVSITTALETELENVREPVMRVLRDLEEDIDRDKLRRILIYSKKLGTFEQKARLVRDAIDDLLEADDDLAAMYLTEKGQGHEREDDNHEEVELLLESYHKVCDEIVQVSSNLISAIRNTEEVSRAILDANRNSLMLLGLKVDIGTMGISVGMFIAALYGMNLENFIEETNYGFFGISGFCTVLSIIACMYGLRKLRKVQRLSMWGREGSGRMKIGGQGRAREVEERPMAALAESDRGRHLGETVEGIKRAERMREWQEAYKALRETHKDTKLGSAVGGLGKR
ncbi:magnesium ion transporter [Friedmanniomyces endolithicus]|uniref:Magnesium transporter n=1 Tax=Friedmanniomyces endolithicus TaxID=329885 RepID=A0AAN6H609_9PEZI|nr:magnesium ion transporter [Friedmanniomyces endolithicus]KAK0774216.1 magnesium ion transporter [Friedmanniomyces endolithicus]KAK0775590.1 magnesium ion transporter [Friedmanniomyces endolithicus]KAK0776275.1 magnesium ion transporter [Friedmanniomyces endolithicus]KAK0863834.1 magnesium ion transporter [Friedmanniomyces endolithicus]